MVSHMHPLYHIQRHPFSIHADGTPLFLSSAHQAAWQSIVTGIEERKGLGVLYGVSGVGKTTLARAYMERAEPQTVKVLCPADAALPLPEILKRIYGVVAHPVGTDFASNMLEELRPILLEEYRQDRNPVLIIDNAHDLSQVTLANLGHLASLQQDDAKLIQLVLLGQPALAAALTQPALQPLQQHVAVCATLTPLTPEESLAYIQHGLAQVTEDDAPIFSPAALHYIVKCAGGIPRTLNILCVDVFNAGLARAERPISITTAEDVLADFRGYAPYRKRVWALRRVGAWQPRLKERVYATRGWLQQTLLATCRRLRDTGNVSIWLHAYARLIRWVWQDRHGLSKIATVWRFSIKTITDRWRLCAQHIRQHSLQHLRSGLRELRLRRIDALNAQKPSRAKRRASQAVNASLPHTDQPNGRLWWKGVYVSAGGLLLLAALWWFTLPSNREERRVTAALTTPSALSVPPLQATTSQEESLATPVSTVTEARLAVVRLRAQAQPDGNEALQGGARVRLLQERLQHAGFTPGPIDGVLGPKTRQAVRQFQKAHGLRATGRLNAATRQALGF